MHKSYPIMFLQATEIIRKHTDQQKIHSKTIFQRNFINKDRSAYCSDVHKKTATQKTPCVGQIYLDQGITLLRCQKNEGRR